MKNPHAVALGRMGGKAGTGASKARRVTSEQARAAARARWGRRKAGNILSNLKTHDASLCKGEHCCVHNPSDHHMRNWPMNWRDDIGVMERICPHGVGHPDPDDAAHNARNGRGYMTVHGCDGCCQPPKGKRKKAKK